MKRIPRHVIDLELAEEGAEAKRDLMSSLRQSARANPDALSLLLGASRACAGYFAAISLETAPVCDALHMGAQAAGAMFALGAGSGSVEVALGDERFTLQSTGATSSTHPGSWRIGWWLAHIVGDQSVIGLLGATTPGTLRGSSTKGDECQYLFIEALQAFEKRAADWSAKLRAAVDATDPTRVKLIDEEFVLDILVPEMELLLRLATGEVAPFNEALSFALDRHRKYWSRGTRKRDPSGFLALGALAMAGMARAAGMPIDVESDYLPRPLVEERCKD